MRLSDRRGSAPWRALMDAVLGAWMIASAFLLARDDASEVNTWLVGAVIVIASLAMVHFSAARHVVAAAAAWFFFSSFAIFLSGAQTLLHDLLLAFAIFATALLPAQSVRRFRGVTPSPGPSTSP